MQCARMCEKWDESSDPFSVPSFHRSVFCRRLRRNYFGAGTNGRVTEAQQQGQIGRQTWARDELSSQRAWVLGCWGWGRRDGSGASLWACLPHHGGLSSLEGHHLVRDLTQLWEHNTCKHFPPRKRVKPESWMGEAWLCPWLYNHKRKSRVSAV